tara:strand:+ start:246 stop:947 length:702 start_codon:yes stop_codon:yes gene_type:complete
MTGISAGKTWSRIGAEVAPTSSAASGVWQIGELAENVGAGTWPAPLSGVFECIAKETVSGSSTTSVEFGTIPTSTYDNIEVVVSWVPATSDSTPGISWLLEIETNGEAANNYSVNWLYSDGSSTSSSASSSALMYTSQPFYMGYTQYQNGMFNRQRWTNINTNTYHIGHTLSGSGIPGQPLGPSGQTGYWYDKYGMNTQSYSSPLTSIKFVSEWSRIIEAGTTFTMFGIKSSS